MTSRSQFPATYKDDLTDAHHARGMSATAILNVEPLLRPLAPDVEIVVPVYNEEDQLATSVHLLHDYLSRNFPLSWVITVADNASTDGTWAIACQMAKELDGVRALHLGQKGRGRALRTAWTESTATVVAYMDVDLSTDLDALLPLVAPLVTGHSDVAIGSRLARGARVVRGPKREFISRTYNFILRATLHNSFSDAQCGFKAMRADVARQLLPLVADNGWFFDTELLVLAERNGLRVHEVAVDWVDDPGSTVDIVRTARDDLKGIVRMLRTPARGPGGIVRPARDPAAGYRPAPSPAGELVHLAGVGVVSVVSFAALFGLLYGVVGAVPADILALAVCAVVNWAVSTRAASPQSTITSITSARPGGSGGPGRRHFHPTGLVFASLPLVATLGALVAISAAGVASLPVDVVVLTAAFLCSLLARLCSGRRYLWRRSASRQSVRARR